MVFGENGDLDEAAGAADATACSWASRFGGVEISWVTEKGGPRDPTTQKDAGGTPGSKITAHVLGWVGESGIQQQTGQPEKHLRLSVSRRHLRRPARVEGQLCEGGRALIRKRAQFHAHR